MIRTVIAIICFFYLFSTPIFANYGAQLCKQDPQFSCYKVKGKDSWQRLFPDEARRDVVMRANRMGNSLHSGLIIAIPVSETVAALDISPFEKQITAPNEKVIYVSLKELAWGAYDSSGALINWGPVSTAKGYCPDLHQRCHTPTGNFRIYNKEGSGCKSRKFPIGRGGAPMPYCMFFHGGFALHGSYDLPGYNASHGCVRMLVKDAKWLNQEFVGDEDVAVIVTK